MKVFLDANVLVSVLNKEYPRFSHTSRVLGLADTAQFTLYTSSLCLAIGYYFASKKSGNAMAKRKLAILADKLSIAEISASAVRQALNNDRVSDVEDGFQYYAAREVGCQCIVTDNVSDFYFGDLDVLRAEDFLIAHVYGKKLTNKKGT